MEEDEEEATPSRTWLTVNTQMILTTGLLGRLLAMGLDHSSHPETVKKVRLFWKLH
jgi:hypothetical protein